MNTKILKVNSRKPEKNKINQAAEIIKNGGLVAFPTETVYGLGADIFNDRAIKNIFKSKQRPFNDPLIVHIAQLDDLYKLTTEVPGIALKLAEKFWPGPLTIVLRKSTNVSNYITSGLDTVAVRMPKNKIALALIKASKTPIAAPSANKFTRPSPTIAKHVLDDLNHKIPLILDGGQTQIGIESTVIDLTSKTPTILRPGGVIKEKLEKILNVKINTPETNIIKSPGMHYKHYCPQAKVILIMGKFNAQLIKDYPSKNFAVIKFNKNTNYLAKTLFKKFRSLDKQKTDTIFVESVPERGLGASLMNRIKKAASEIITV